MQPPIATAELLLVGTELTTGETRDSNGAELAAELTRRGVAVARLVALPDALDAVTGAIRTALQRVDLVVTSGGLGPTPDDLTREAIAAACGATPFVDPELERWLRELFERRGIVMPEVNRKQAWLIEGATPLRNDQGTAPGWWVERPDGRVIVALPGPPREMRAIWRGEVLPRLEARGVGVDAAVRTLRLTDIGESHVAERLGEELLRATNPIVATYARPDAVDVRISARVPGGGAAAAVGSEAPDAGTLSSAGASATSLVEAAERTVRERLGPHIFAVDDETWAEAIAKRLAGRRLATLEVGTGGSLAALLGGVAWHTYAEAHPAGWPGPGIPVAGGGGGAADPSARRADDRGGWIAHDRRPPADGAPAAGADLAGHVRRVRRAGAADIGLAIVALEDGSDTQAHVAVAAGRRVIEERRTVFQTGEQGRRRAALAACSVLWRTLEKTLR